MTMSFGSTDAEGGWNWRDAYDAIELAVVLQLRRLAPQVSRLEDAPAQIVALLAGLNALTLTHSRRSEEQVALDQFSTPPELAAVAVVAAQIRPGDGVLEPSAGTGLLAIIAEACGATLALNEIAPHRAGLLDLAFPVADRTRHDAVHLPDLLPSSGSFHAVLANPPYQQLGPHLHAALACLADGGRLSAIVPARLFEDAGATHALGAKGRLIATLAFPARAYAKHGTSVETGLLVIDRDPGEGRGAAGVIQTDDLAQLARLAAALPARPSAQVRQFRPSPTPPCWSPGRGPWRRRRTGWVSWARPRPSPTRPVTSPTRAPSWGSTSPTGWRASRFRVRWRTHLPWWRRPPWPR